MMMLRLAPAHLSKPVRAQDAPPVNDGHTHGDDAHHRRGQAVYDRVRVAADEAGGNEQPGHVVHGPGLEDEDGDGEGEVEEQAQGVPGQHLVLTRADGVPAVRDGCGEGGQQEAGRRPREHLEHDEGGVARHGGGGVGEPDRGQRQDYPKGGEAGDGEGPYRGGRRHDHERTVLVPAV